MYRIKQTPETAEFLEWLERRKQEENISYKKTAQQLGWHWVTMSRLRGREINLPTKIYLRYKELIGRPDPITIATEALQKIHELSDCGDYATAIVNMKAIAGNALKQMT